MSDPKRLPDADVDALVRAYLNRQADAVDGRAMLARVRPPRFKPAPVWRSRLRWGLALAAAAAVLVAFLGGIYIGPTPVSAETLVRQAQEIHNLPVDRCYLVVSHPEPGAADRFPLLAQPRETHLWTRGDRFWMESALPGKRWKWGRDDQHRVWVTRSRDEGVLFDADEVPEGLGVACDVLGMQTETLLAVLLKDFNLRRETQPATAPGVHLIHAELKPDHSHPGLQAASLEIDAESKVLRHAVLVRAFQGVRLATVTFTLIETSPQSDTRYQLEGHLDEGAAVYTKDHQPLIRRRLLLALVGRILP